MIKQKFFVRLFAAYVLVALLYTIIVVTVFYYKNNQIVQIQLNNKYKIFIEQVREKNDTKLMTALNLIGQLKTNDTIIEYATNPQLNFYNITKVYDQLAKNIIPFANLGFSVAIKKDNQDIVVTPNNTIDVNLFNESIGLANNNQREMQDFFDKNRITGANYVVNNKVKEDPSENTFTIIKKENFQSDKGVTFYISFYEKHFLPQVDSYENEAFVILKDNQIFMLKTEMDTKIVYNLLDTISSLEEDKSKRSVYTKLGKSKYDMHCINSSAFDWKYIYITPKNIVQKEMKGVIIDSILVQLALLMLGLILALIITRKMYKPISNIIAVFRGYDERHAGQDELEYIQETVEKVSRANGKLRETIQNNRLPLKNKFLRDLLYGLVTKGEIENQIKSYELELLDGQLTAVILEFVNYKDLDDNFPKEAILSIKAQVLFILQEQIKKDINCELFELDYKRYVAIMKEGDSLKIKKVLNMAFSNVEANFELSMVAAVGEVCPNVYQLEKSFNSASTLLELKYSTGKKAVITLDNLDNLKNEYYYYPLDVERNLISCIIKGNRSEFNTTFLRILDENLLDRNLNREARSQFIFAIVATINRIVQQLNKNTNEFFEEGTILYVELKMYEDNYGLKQRLIDIFDTIFNKVDVESEKIDKAISNSLLGFIHENFNKDISLIDIAEHFNLSTGYISFLFKNVTGENFKDYLNVYRINKAKEILETQKDVKIKDLAEMVGCNSINTFLRVFKKYEGISPGQYLKDKASK